MNTETTSCQVKIPININNSTFINNKCSLTCNLTYNYKLSTIAADNNVTGKNNSGNYIQITLYDKNNKVTFNNIEYIADSINIYYPSLHTYDNKRADGEILINHSAGNQYLIISVPIKSNPFLAKNTTFLYKLLMDLSNQNIGESLTPKSYGLNLENIVPYKPFFYYKSCSNTLFPNSSSDDTYVIVFDYSPTLAKSGALNVTPDFIRLLTSMINNPVDISLNTPLKNSFIFYNENGPSLKSQDNIYIDCSPTNEVGTTIVNETSEPPNIFGGIFDNINNKDKVIKIVQFILAFFLIFIILWVAKKLILAILNKFTPAQQQNGGSFIT